MARQAYLREKKTRQSLNREETPPLWYASAGFLLLFLFLTLSRDILRHTKHLWIKVRLRKKQSERESLSRALPLSIRFIVVKLAFVSIRAERFSPPSKERSSDDLPPGRDNSIVQCFNPHCRTFNNWTTPFSTTHSNHMVSAFRLRKTNDNADIERRRSEFDSSDKLNWTMYWT